MPVLRQKSTSSKVCSVCSGCAWRMLPARIAVMDLKLAPKAQAFRGSCCITHGTSPPLLPPPPPTMSSTHYYLPQLNPTLCNRALCLSKTMPSFPFPCSTAGFQQTEYRVIVTGLPPSASWQDLKDHMRKAGEPTYTDVVSGAFTLALSAIICSIQ